MTSNRYEVSKRGEAESGEWHQSWRLSKLLEALNQSRKTKVNEMNKYVLQTSMFSTSKSHSYTCSGLPQTRPCMSLGEGAWLWYTDTYIEECQQCCHLLSGRKPFVLQYWGVMLILLVLLHSFLNEQFTSIFSVHWVCSLVFVTNSECMILCCYSTGYRNMFRTLLAWNCVDLGFGITTSMKRLKCKPLVPYASICSIRILVNLSGQLI